MNYLKFLHSSFLVMNQYFVTAICKSCTIAHHLYTRITNFETDCMLLYGKIIPSSVAPDDNCNTKEPRICHNNNFAPCGNTLQDNKYTK